jgi:hypothetical protein
VVKLTLLTSAIVLFSAAVPSANAMTAAGEASTSRTLVNGARANAGLASLPIDPRLERIAREHSAHMAERGSISHSDDLGREASAEGVDWGWLGENVGVGPDARTIHDGFMRSPHHKEVVLHRDASAIGVGVTIGEDGRVYLTQVYAKLRGARPAQVVAERRTIHAAAARLIPAAPPTPEARERSADPNVVIDGIVSRGVFAPIDGHRRAGWSANGR